MNFLGLSTAQLIAQLFGLAATFIMVSSFQVKDRRRLLTLQMLGSLTFGLQFLLLGAYTGVAMNIVGVIRAIIFSQDKKWTRHIGLPIGFCLIFIAATALSWEGAISVLPCLAMLLATVSQWLKRPVMIKLVTLPAAPCWIVYNIVNKAYTGTLTEAIVGISIIVGLVRCDLIPYIKAKRAHTD